MKYDIAAYSTAGGYRQVNEDNLYVNGEIKEKNLADYSKEVCSEKISQLVAVFDGMGGEAAGEMAAYIAADSLRYYQDTIEESINDYLFTASNNIIEKKNTGKASGCTVAILSIDGDRVRSYNLGDSRIYLIRDNQLILLSKDHTEFSTLLSYGVLSEEDYYSSPSRNKLTRYLGGTKEEMAIEPYISDAQKVEDGDTFLLCTDGMCGTLRAEQIVEVIKTEKSLTKASADLANFAIESGSKDNVTVVLLRCSN